MLKHNQIHQAYIFLGYSSPQQCFIFEYSVNYFCDSTINSYFFVYFWPQAEVSPLYPESFTVLHNDPEAETLRHLVDWSIVECGCAIV